MGPNRQRRRREPIEKKAPQKPSRPKAPTLVSSAARDLIADVLQHAATGGSVPVPERHFDSTLGTKITLQRNAPLTTVEILSRVYEGLGFPRDLVAQYITDMVHAAAFPTFQSVEDLLAVDGSFQPFLVQSCFELFNCITLFKQGDAVSQKSEFDAEVADQILEEELETAMMMFEAQYVGKSNFNDDATSDREVYFIMLTEEEKKILVAIRFPEYYPSDPPMLFIQTVSGRLTKGKQPTLVVPPNCTKDLSPQSRRSIMDAAVEIIVNFSGSNSGCLVPLLSSINGVISGLKSDPAAAAPQVSPPAPTKSELSQQRKAFLGSLRDIQNNPPNAAGGESGPAISMPERVELATIEMEAADLEQSPGDSLRRHRGMDAALKSGWEKLRREGTLSGARKKLPAYDAREDLRHALSTHNVVVIGGETGSGKTTQIPQYLYEFFCEEGRGSSANIVCTQPRRLAATSVALRVAEERDDAVGGTVGYSIRLENCISSRTQITYCTTGIVLRRLQTDKYLTGVSHVVVDEIHERGVDTDFLLILLRDLLGRRKDLIVVLMSATMDSELFSHYFGGAPVLSIKGRTFPVQVYHLEEIIPLVQYHLESGCPYEKRLTAPREGAQRNARKQNLILSYDDISFDMAELEEQKKTAATVKGSPETIDTLSRMNLDIINYELIESIVVYIDQVLRVEGAVLVFLPGMAEIQNCMRQLQSNNSLAKNCVFYNLHSSLGSADQQGVFSRPPRGKRKIILGTNIMETSITIDDAVYVIDTGKVKENRYNARKCMSELVTVTTSKANCRQRQGRAGRVREGYCFRLFTSAQFEEMESHQLCEMHRVSLESLILQIYSLNLGDEVEYLQKALSPPEERAINSSVKVLMTLGALTKEKRLTSLGQHLANLPLDVRVGKMIIHGALLHCIDPVLTMAACLSVRSPFSGTVELRAEVEGMRRAFTGMHLSDQLASWFAYNKWIGTLHQHGPAAARTLCEQAYLSQASLSQIQSTKRQYERYLCEAGFIEGAPKRSAAAASSHFLFPPYTSLNDTVYEAGGQTFNQNSGSVLCILACLVAGLYPNVARFKVPRKKMQPAPFARRPANRFITFDGTDCMIHPSSVAAKGDGTSSALVVYVDKVKTSDIFLREVSAVSPLHVILFGGGKLEYLAAYKELCVDEVTAFKCEEEEATLLMHFKDQLHSALTTKINDPSKSWESVSSVVVRAIVKLLNDTSSTGRGLKVIDRRQPRAPVTEDLAHTEDGTNTAREEGSRSSRPARECFHCGEADHLAKDCPHMAQEKKGGPPVRCFICGMWHFPLFCPLCKPLDK
eukprot:gene651-368_t